MGADAIDREDFVKALLAEPGGLLVVTGLGGPGSDVAAAGERDLNFPLFGAMGAAAGVGFGLALAQPDRRVLVVTGDGELMMNLGILATIAVQRPGNLAIVVLDNERFGATGFQKSHTAHGVDLAGMAQASGFVEVMLAREPGEVPAVVQRARQGRGPFLAVVKVAARRYPNRLRISSGVELKSRFRHALLGGG